MSHYVATASGERLAEITGSRSSEARCLFPVRTRIGTRPCNVLLQRSVDGELVDGVRAHYKTVHPEKRL